MENISHYIPFSQPKEKMGKSAEEEHPQKAFGWAAMDSSGILSPFKFSRRANGEDDVTIKILYCGICHSDLHFIKNEFGISSNPLVPGHEIVGILTQVGHNVTKFKIGDKVGVGGVIGSCRVCNSCKQDHEVQCRKMILTCGAIYYDGTATYGGFSDTVVVNEHFVSRLPDNLPLDGVAPLLCAGITVYSPMKYFDLCKPGMSLGVVGLGGLGHLAVKFAKAFGMKVTVISTSPKKEKESIERLGADSFLVSHDPEKMQAAIDTLDGIIDTVPAPHSLQPLIDLLKPNGKLVMVGVTNKPFELPIIPLIIGRKIVAGSAGGGMKETQDMIDFAGKHNITADIEVISMDYINTAMERLTAGDVKY
ncbi:probable mannitol dehydrogenase [Magnolia sinica]|uniref:probable mannitol dehydrogenase n=1 Tax=Magnolia sinica TaxID=86752 RepID=UPI002659889E|nr:probable mannitol dehydrogenase [Magnolia sinica]